ncbi:predicted protein [Histoplasma capsulatum var. duboisii H88]|uniref:Predicted protein n=1 Tax=Ajellomyces capsulatus (strain H88) TaxID=544711 RepID=F0UFZ6_AJEC8|nr:predicted protein [Histoplasma capsulatum var. duboisii H88]
MVYSDEFVDAEDRDMALKVHLALEDHIITAQASDHVFRLDILCQCNLSLIERQRNMHLHSDLLKHLSSRSLVMQLSAHIPFLKEAVCCNCIDSLSVLKHLIPQYLTEQHEKHHNQSLLQRGDSLIDIYTPTECLCNLDFRQLSFDLVQRLLKVKFFLYIK